VNLSDVIEELEKEKGLDRAVLSSIICEGMQAAYKKKYPELEFKAAHDKKTGEVVIFVEKIVVAAVESEAKEIGLRKARFIDKSLNENDKVWVPFDGKIGRIEVMRAKHVIASKILEIESKAIYKEFKDKVGAIVYGVIHKCERAGAMVKIQDFFAFLPKSLTPPGDKCTVGFPVRALLKEVLLQPKNESQLVLDKSSGEFLKKLFELEVPEVFEKLVEIKKIVRSPGYKSKVLVFSHDKNIDPVGACVGVGGARIKPILKELGGERVDIIAWRDSREDLIKDSLKPAVVRLVELIDDKNANVWLDEDQRSVAIGKKGQNIALASALTGVAINLMEGRGGSGFARGSDVEGLSDENVLGEDLDADE